MKESKLLEMQNKIASMSNVVQQLINEVMNLRELSVGTYETVKLLPGYDKAIEELKSNLAKKQEEKNSHDAFVYKLVYFSILIYLGLFFCQKVQFVTADLGRFIQNGAVFFNEGLLLQSNHWYLHLRILLRVYDKKVQD